MSDTLGNMLVAIKELNGTLQGVQENQVSLLAGVKIIRAELPRFIEVSTGRFDRLEAEQVRIQSEIMDRVDRLQETVEHIREDARVN